MPSPGERVAVTECMNREPRRVSVRCDLWGVKLNASKTKTMIVSRICTVHPQSTLLTLDGTVLNEPADLVILAVTFDVKMTIQEHLRRFPVMQLIGLGSHHRLLLLRSFWSFILPVLEYCSAVWWSAGDSHLNSTTGLSCQEFWFHSWWCFNRNLVHRGSVAVLCMLFKSKK